jgi:hypothetical protein
MSSRKNGPSSATAASADLTLSAVAGTSGLVVTS